MSSAMILSPLPYHSVRDLSRLRFPYMVTASCPLFLFSTMSGDCFLP